ncbi:MAG TPA: AbrB family transcriptional regulator [Pseudonocardia sp.]|jgi:hypothetical protein
MTADRERPAWLRWALLVGLTVPPTVLLAVLGAPSPALFAALTVGTALALAGWAPSRVPRPLTAAAQAVIGAVIGLLSRPRTLSALAEGWLPVLAVSVGTLAVSMATGLLLGTRPGVTKLTGMLALTAGGASGLVAVARDLGADERMVAVVQYLRVGLVTLTMPVLAAVLFGAGHTDRPPDPVAVPPPWYLGVAVVVGCAAVGVPLARLLRVPAGALLGPMVVALVLALTLPAAAVVPPDPLVEVAYAIIGWQAGVRFTRESLRTVAEALPLATLLIVVIIGASAALGALLTVTTPATGLEAYLATTPGGLYAVLATAISAGVDVTFVVGVQVVRVIIMLLVAPYVARWAGRRWGGEPG